MISIHKWKAYRMFHMGHLSRSEYRSLVLEN